MRPGEGGESSVLDTNYPPPHLRPSTTTNRRPKVVTLEERYEICYADGPKKETGGWRMRGSGCDVR